jgi:hypothetical protein
MKAARALPATARGAARFTKDRVFIQAVHLGIHLGARCRFSSITHQFWILEAVLWLCSISMEKEMCPG